MFKDGRVPLHATCGPWVNNPWCSYSKEVCRDLKQQAFKAASIESSRHLLVSLNLP